MDGYVRSAKIYDHGKIETYWNIFHTSGCIDNTIMNNSCGVCDANVDYECYPVVPETNYLTDLDVITPC